MTPEEETVKLFEQNDIDLVATLPCDRLKNLLPLVSKRFLRFRLRGRKMASNLRWSVSRRSQTADADSKHGHRQLAERLIVGLILRMNFHCRLLRAGAESIRKVSPPRCIGGPTLRQC